MGKNTLGYIVITRLIPEVGSADMAARNILIELNNDSRPNQFGAVFVAGKL